MIPFPLISCGLLLFSANIAVSNQQPAKSGVDHHETAIPTKTPLFAVIPRNFPSMGHLISYLGEDYVLMR